jgi:hypothetical protein
VPTLYEATMTTDGIDALLLETNNWKNGAKFFQAPRDNLEFETDRNFGLLPNGDDPLIFAAEVPETQALAVRIALKVAHAGAFEPAPGLDVVTRFTRRAESVHSTSWAPVPEIRSNRVESERTPARLTHRSGTRGTNSHRHLLER